MSLRNQYHKTCSVLLLVSLFDGMGSAAANTNADEGPHNNNESTNTMPVFIPKVGVVPSIAACMLHYNVV
jgi:hypothetical protein